MWSRHEVANCLLLIYSINLLTPENLTLDILIHSLKIHKIGYIYIYICNKTGWKYKKITAL